MATYSNGATVSFNGSAISEVVGLSVSFGSGMPEGRGLYWRALPGQVQVDSLANILPGVWGSLATLVVSGGGISLTNLAVCTETGATAEVNGITRYTYTFELVG